MSDHNPLDLIALAGKDGRIAELTAELERQSAACESFRLGMLDRERRVVELTNLLKRVRSGYSNAMSRVLKREIDAAIATEPKL